MYTRKLLRMVDEYSPYDVSEIEKGLDLIDGGIATGAGGATYLATKKKLLAAGIGAGSLLIPRTIIDREIMTPEEISADGCICCLPMNEGQGNIVYDKSSHENNGILNGEINWIPGVFRNALEFSGGEEYVDCGNTENPTNNEFTIESWVKFNSFDDVNNDNIVVKWGTYYMRFWSPTYFEGAVFNNGNEKKIAVNPDIKIGEWNKFGFTFNGTNRTIYKNGKIINSIEELMTMDITTDNLWIGRISWGKAHKGGICDTMIYNKCFSPEKMKARFEIEKWFKGL